MAECVPLQNICLGFLNSDTQIDSQCQHEMQWPLESDDDLQLGMEKQPHACLLKNMNLPSRVPKFINGPLQITMFLC